MNTTFGKILSFARPEKQVAIDVTEKSTTAQSSIAGLSSLYDDDGISIDQYRDMLEREPQLKASVYLKIYARISTSWTIEPASSAPQDVEVAEFVKDQLQQMSGTMDGVLRRAMLAMAYKLSVQEIVYKYIESGKWAGKYGWAAIKPKPSDSFSVAADPYGNIKSLQQKTGDGRELTLDPNYFLIWAWENDGSWKGKSDLRAAYRWYKSKDLIARFWNIFLERFAMPMPMAKHPAGANADAVKKLVDHLAALTTNKAVAVPKDWEVEFIEAMRQGGDYQGAIDYCDRMMARASLVPQLVLDEGKSGSYSLGKSHGESFKWVLNSLGQELEEDIIGDQLIRRLVDWNYTVESYPQFRFKPFTDDAFGEIAQAFATLVDKGIVGNDEPVVRERLTLPARVYSGAGGDQTGGGADGAPSARGAAPASTTPPPLATAPSAQSADDTSKSGSASGDSSPRGSNSASPPGSTSPSGRRKTDPGLGFEVAPEAPAASLLKHADKMDFAETAKRLDEIEATATHEAARAIQLMHQDLKRELKRKGIVEAKDYTAVDKLKLGHVGELRIALASGLGLALAHGAEDGYGAVSSGLDAVGSTKLPAPADRTSLNFDADELTFAMRDIIDFWKGKVPIQKELLKHYDRQAFTIAGNVSETLLSQAQAAIGRGMVRGSSYGAIESAINDIFEPYYLTEIDPIVGTSARLHNIVRTATSEAYNTGQMNMYRDPEVGDYVRAFEYSSVMDNRTSEYCRAWHSVVLKKDDPRWAAAIPPNHYQCRATLIPIVQGEAYTETANPPSMLPMLGFRT